MTDKDNRTKFLRQIKVDDWFSITLQGQKDHRYHYLDFVLRSSFRCEATALTKEAIRKLISALQDALQFMDPVHMCMGCEMRLHDVIDGLCKNCREPKTNTEEHFVRLMQTSPEFRTEYEKLVNRLGKHNGE